MKFVLVNRILLLYVCNWLFGSNVCIAYIQYVYVCTKDKSFIAYRDIPCPNTYKQKIIFRYVPPATQVLETNTNKKSTKTRRSKQNNAATINKAQKDAEKQKRQKDRCDSVKERISISEDKYKSGYKPSQKIKLDRNMQTLRRLAKKYCIP